MLQMLSNRLRMLSNQMRKLSAQMWLLSFRKSYFLTLFFVISEKVLTFANGTIN